MLTKLLVLLIRVLQSDHGSAVTSFVTEHRKRKPSHTENFTIEVEFVNMEEINEQILELLFSFRDLYRKGLEEEAADVLYQRIEKRSEIALNTLQRVFPNKYRALLIRIVLMRPGPKALVDGTMSCCKKSTKKPQTDGPKSC